MQQLNGRDTTLCHCSITHCAAACRDAVRGHSKTCVDAAVEWQVDESMRVCSGGGTMAIKERVEALSIPYTAVDGFIADDSIAKTPGLCFGLLWARQWLQQHQKAQ